MWGGFSCGQELGPGGVTRGAALVSRFNALQMIGFPSLVVFSTHRHRIAKSVSVPHIDFARRMRSPNMKADEAKKTPLNFFFRRPICGPHLVSVVLVVGGLSNVAGIVVMRRGPMPRGGYARRGVGSEIQCPSNDWLSFVVLFLDTWASDRKFSIGAPY